MIGMASIVTGLFRLGFGILSKAFGQGSPDFKMRAIYRSSSGISKEAFCYGITPYAAV